MVGQDSCIFERIGVEVFKAKTGMGRSFFFPTCFFLSFFSVMFISAKLLDTDSDRRTFSFLKWELREGVRRTGGR